MCSFAPLHYRDPFDRLIIAQGIRVTSRDVAFSAYEAEVAWA